MPTEISMQNDIQQWKNDEITEDENYLLNAALDFLLEVSSSLAIICFCLPFGILQMLSVASIYCVKHLKRVLRQSMVVYICDSRSDIDEVFTAYETIEHKSQR